MTANVVICPACGWKGPPGHLHVCEPADRMKPEPWEYETDCERCGHVLALHDDDARCTVPTCRCVPAEPAPAPPMAECPKCFHSGARHNVHGDCTICGRTCFSGEPRSAGGFSPCPVCKRQIPNDAYELHFENCKAAWTGYFGPKAFVMKGG